MKSKTQELTRAWRIKHGRDPRSGRRLDRSALLKVKSIPMPIVRREVEQTGDLYLVILALRIAANVGREDLRARYLQLADALLCGTVKTFEGGDGI